MPAAALPRFRISTHAPAGGATDIHFDWVGPGPISTHAPAGGATHPLIRFLQMPAYFYSRPCGRGDVRAVPRRILRRRISTHAPAGGATCAGIFTRTTSSAISTHAPAGGATGPAQCRAARSEYFYSRPCGRGDSRRPGIDAFALSFLLTPLREGRPPASARCPASAGDFYSRPCGRGDRAGGK